MEVIRMNKVALPIGQEIIAFGAGMSSSRYVIIDERMNAAKIEKHDDEDYFSPFIRVDNHTKHIRDKFGIGFYYTNNVLDIDIQMVIDKCNKEVAAIEKRKADKADADKRQQELLISANPHLKPFPRDWKEEKDNLLRDLKRVFPNSKFSVRREYYDSYTLTVGNKDIISDVRQYVRKWDSYSFDASGDFYDYTPDNWNKVFGGFKYLHVK